MSIAVEEWRATMPQAARDVYPMYRSVSSRQPYSRGWPCFAS
jgi:hypothetical protein